MQVILYDGDCGFCASSIRFVWKRDREGIFKYASIQSAAGAQILREHGVEEPRLDTMYLAENGSLWDRSEAALRVVARLPGYGIPARLALLIPRFIRDRVYDLVARNRHRLGGSDQCEVPPEEVRKRFLDGG